MKIRHFLKRLFSVVAWTVAGSGILVGLVSCWVVWKFSGTATLPADCAVVFGAAVHQSFDKEENALQSFAGPGIQRRVQTAANLYRQKMITTLYLTGGKGEGMLRSEAEVMKEYAINEGVRAGDIVLEEQARSTWENIKNTKPLTAHCKSVVGISDRYHLARIEYLARKQGWELKTIPSTFQSTPWFELRSVIREALGILFYTVFDS